MTASSQEPAVSVIVPYFDGAPFIRECVESVLGQTISRVDLIVVDDCSPREASRFLESVSAHLRLVRLDRRMGVSEARNHGARIAEAEVLAFLDQDDSWPPELVEVILPNVRPGTAYCYDNEITSEGGRPTGETLFGQKPHWSCRSLARRNMHLYFADAPILKGFVHREDFERVGGFDSRFDGVEDFHFFVKLLVAGTRLELLDEPRGFYRYTKGSVTSQTSMSPRGIDLWLRIFEAMPRELGLPPQAAKACARLRRYWLAREAEHLLVSRIRERHLSSLASPALMRRLVESSPGIVRLQAAKLRRRAL